MSVQRKAMSECGCAVQARVRNMNRLATMQRAVNSVVSTDYVLGIGGYALEAVSAQVCMSAAAILLQAALLRVSECVLQELISCIFL